MHISLREQWKLGTRFVTRSHAEAIAHLCKMSQQMEQLPPPLSITVAKSLALSPSAHAILSGERGADSAKSSTQVTVVRDNLSHTPDVVGQCAPQHLAGASLPLAGASPHAPHPSQRGKKRKGTKDSDLNLRLTSVMKSQLGAKCEILETYPSAHVLELIAANLGLPTDEHRATRNKYLKKAFADLRVAFDDCGVNLNQMAKATNSGKPCPLTRPEINKALADFARGCRMLESLRP